MKTLSKFFFSGAFLFLASALFASDVEYFGVIKSQSYHQTTSSPPSILSSNGYMLNAFIIATTNDVVTNASLRLSTGLTRTLLPETNNLAWRYTEYFNSQSAMDATYPGTLGYTYTMTMGTVHDGVHSGNLDFVLLFFPLSYPSVPQITNLVAGQNIDTTRDFTLGWNSLGGSTLEIVQLTVMDMASNVVFASPAPFAGNALSGASTSIVIPPNTLPAGTNLQAHLTIASPDLPNTNYAVGVSALARDTAFELATRPAPVAPRLEVSQPGAGQIQLQFHAEAERVYHLQTTTDWTNWTELLVTNPASNTVTYTDAEANHSQRFYRVRVSP